MTEPTETPETAETHETTAGQPEPHEKMFTQAEVNDIIASRLKRAKANDDEMAELRAKAAHADELQTQLDKLTKENERKSLLDKVAKEKGLPTDLLDATGFDTEEQLGAYADKLLAYTQANAPTTGALPPATPDPANTTTDDTGWFHELLGIE